jgi:hypothetical protein
MLQAGASRMEWALRLVGMGIDGQFRNFEVMAISRPDSGAPIWPPPPIMGTLPIGPYSANLSSNSLSSGGKTRRIESCPTRRWVETIRD